MANIPIEKKGGTPWWLWLLGLLLAAAVIWLLVELFDDDTDVATLEPIPEEVTPAPIPEAPLASEGAISSLATILDAENPEQLVGREVNLTGVTARSVTGDSTYWVYNPDEGIERRVFVVLYELGESEPGPGTGADGRFNVDEGNNMRLEGTVQRVEDSDPAAWGVTDDEVGELREGGVYIRATSLENA